MTSKLCTCEHHYFSRLRGYRSLTPLVSFNFPHPSHPTFDDALNKDYASIRRSIRRCQCNRLLEPVSSHLGTLRARITLATESERLKSTSVSKCIRWIRPIGLNGKDQLASLRQLNAQEMLVNRIAHFPCRSDRPDCDLANHRPVDRGDARVACNTGE